MLIPASIKKQQGLSIIEMTLVIIIVAIMFIEAYKGMSKTVGNVEKAQVEATIGALKSGLAIQYLNLVVNNHKDQVKFLKDQNPFTFLQPKPSNYRGTIKRYNAYLTKESWFFNEQTKEIHYIIKNKNSFIKNKKQLRYKLLLNNEQAKLPSINLWKLKEQIHAPK